jgi:hypothetical protein
MAVEIFGKVKDPTYKSDTWGTRQKKGHPRLKKSPPEKDKLKIAVRR